MNQTRKIKEYLESGKSITSMEAFQKWGITRLSDKIFKLKQRGMMIDSIPTEGTNRFGDPVYYSTYRLSTLDKITKGKKK